MNRLQTLGSATTVDLVIERSSPDQAAELLDELSAELQEKTGSDGRQSFNASDTVSPRSIFLIAYQKQQKVGCGALRPLAEEICEIKRMYTKVRNSGIGATILRELEMHAVAFGYRKVRLETRAVNQGAVNFYLKNGYVVCRNFGKYQGRPECVCLEKVLPQ